MTATDHRGFPYETFPTGWYQVAWSDDAQIGTPVPLTYFDREMVLYRGESGSLHMFDAFCPHMGAHLGYGGTVKGENIVCPYHAWQFDTEGRNYDIPYEEGPNRTRLRRWEVVEAGTMVFAWFSEEGAPPSWDPPAFPELDGSGHYIVPTSSRHTWESVRLKPQFITENAVDAAHQKYVHGAADVPQIVAYEADDAIFRAHYEIEFGRGKGKTWLTPDGKPKIAALLVEFWGLSIGVARFEIDHSIDVQTTTPIDHEFCESRLTVILRKEDTVDGEPSESAARRFRYEIKQFNNDLPIWEHMRYSFPTPFSPAETKRFRALRSWSTQFYPDAVPGHFGRHKTGQTQEAPVLDAATAS